MVKREIKGAAVALSNILIVFVGVDDVEASTITGEWSFDSMLTCSGVSVSSSALGTVFLVVVTVFLVLLFL